MYLTCCFFFLFAANMMFQIWHALSGSDDWREDYCGYDKIDLFNQVVSLFEDAIDSPEVQATLVAFNEYVGIRFLF
jgi:hypothetical protein